MLKKLIPKNLTNISNNKPNIPTLNSPPIIHNLPPKEIQPIIRKFPTIFLPPKNRTQKPFTLTIIIIFNSFNSKIFNKFNSILIVYINIFINVDENIIKGLNTDEL